jgi:molecular chaperone GrpE
MNPSDEENQGPVIRDRRRIDPLTGQVRDIPGQVPGRHSAAQQSGPHATAPAGTAGGGAAPGGGGGSGSADPAPEADPAITLALAERTADLQRLQAEYANYRKRVERDRIAVREQALASVLSELLPVLDDIGRAREHGELTGGFKSVAESLEASAAKLGLTTYGEAGDPFDPTLHDALMHSYSADVTEPTCVQILQPGYKVGDRIVRPARVAVAEPGDDTPGAGTEDE